VTYRFRLGPKPGSALDLKRAFRPLGVRTHRRTRDAASSTGTELQSDQSVLQWIVLGAMVPLLLWAEIAASPAQQLPLGGGPIPPVRRGANGQIEIAPPDAAAARPGVGRHRAAPAAIAPPPSRQGSDPAVIARKPAAMAAGLASAVRSTVGTHFTVLAEYLPLPMTTAPYRLDPLRVQRPAGLMPQAPNGFSVSIFATNFGNPRWLAVAPNGDVFVAASENGKIIMLRDAKGDGVASRITTFATGFVRPHGLAFHDGALYVGDLRAIWRLPYRDGDTIATGEPKQVTIAPDLRPEGEFWTREIAFDAAGRLYLAIGARGDVLADDPPPDASVQEVAADGSMATFASGLRNVVGMAVYPGTNELWGTVNERDKLGAGVPPDYLTRIRRGDFFGWPYAYAGPHPDPAYGSERPDMVAATRVPDLLLEPHSAPLAVVFYDGAQFPDEYKGDAFVAFHGSGPYYKPDGYKVVRVRFANGMPVRGYEDFVTGFMLTGTYPPQVWGRPAGLAVAKDGSLLIADEQTVWRVKYTGH
jgi:glucose/arabinose dehydrogenase